jgi:hypothetical protein
VCFCVWVCVCVCVCVYVCVCQTSLPDPKDALNLYIVLVIEDTENNANEP